MKKKTVLRLKVNGFSLSRASSYKCGRVNSQAQQRATHNVGHFPLQKKKKKKLWSVLQNIQSET